MGTRSLTVVYDGELKPDNEIVTIYTQYDGYPSGHGKKLKRLVGDKKIVNGLSMNGGDQVANGMSCFAAQLITLLKQNVRDHALEMAEFGRKCSEESSAPYPPDREFHDGMAGGVYIYPKGTRDVWEDYIYHFYFVPNEDKGAVRQSVWEAYQADPENNPHPQDVIFEAGTVCLRLESGNKVLYDGPFVDFDPEGDFSESDDESEE